jgi:hypothetical protein
MAARKETDRAWAALSTNLLVLPGAGSLMLGRRSGWPQMALALAGLALSVAWLVVVVRQLMAGGLEALIPVPALGTGLLGIGLFGVAWVWAAATSWDSLRRARGPRP